MNKYEQAQIQSSVLRYEGFQTHVWIFKKYIRNKWFRDGVRLHISQSIFLYLEIFTSNKKYKDK